VAGRWATVGLMAFVIWGSAATGASAQIRVLIEASRDGGAWWGPQVSTFNPNLPHQGKPFADFLRGLGMEVTEVGRPLVVTCGLLTQFDLVVVVDVFAVPPWSPAEIGAYNAFVRNGGRLIYLTDYNRTNVSFPLAASLGLQFSGETDITTVRQFAPHPVTTGVTSLPYVAGSIVTAAPPAATLLAFLGGAPVMGITPLGAGLLFFLGEVNGIQGAAGVPQALVTNLVSFMLSGASRADRCGSQGAAPGAVTSLTGSASGSTLTFTWTPPQTGGAVTSYVLEAGVSPGDSSLASFDTGNIQTAFVAVSVPPGTYFIRVKARNPAGLGPSSNEVVIAVGSACQALPPPPANVNATVAARIVTLTWAAPAGPVSDYVVEAGSAPGLSNVANVLTGNVATSLTANAPPGTYFIRVRARNGCGTSQASNEVMLAVP
jgi:hypothetical protein